MAKKHTKKVSGGKALADVKKNVKEMSFFLEWQVLNYIYNY